MNEIALGKFTRLDHDEDIGPDYSQIIPQRFKLTTDPTVAGFERIPNIDKKVRDLQHRFAKESEEAVYVQIFDEPTESKDFTISQPYSS